MRNRHVQSTGRENEVLLDENLVQCNEISLFPLEVMLIDVGSISPFPVLFTGTR